MANRHISVPIENTVELVNVKPYNPLVSQCEIKVCYVGEEPNRNGSIITKETALKMAASLPGCPIVGYYEPEKKDFGAHDRQIDIVGGTWKITDKTKPYGFVDFGAKMWFQKWNDDGVEHEYLMTEGYLWTSVYEEAKSIIAAGKGQSMELEDNSVQGSWANDDNGFPTFFIINDAMIQKLCVLGDDVEPCFEGAGIAAHFSLQENEIEHFKNELFSLVENIKNALDKGGVNPMEKEQALNPEDLEFKKKEDEEDKDEKETPNDEKPSADDEKENPVPAEKEDEDDKEEDEEKKKAKTKHSLTDEEVASSDLYKTLFAQCEELKQAVNTLKAEIEPLRAFKAETDKKEKQAMIDQFYMLSDEEKKDCVEHIDEYSLDQIEAKLSIICVRNKVSFDLNDKEQEKEKAPMLYDLNNAHDDDDSAPAWIKAVRETAKEIE